LAGAEARHGHRDVDCRTISALRRHHRGHLDAHAYDTSRWYRWSRLILRRPWVAAIGGLTVLLALATPFLGIRFGFPDAQNDPPSFTRR
jgi:uncharacterized membrane protein YdfJ with MMPL/SSD domain